MTELSASDFPRFFREFHGVEPFPWQERLLAEVLKTGSWPSALDLPTGSGKTSAIDIALFHLALEFERGSERRAPLRIAFVVDRRLVVDDAFERAQRISRKLTAPLPGSVAQEVASRLLAISGTSVPLQVARLRGGIPRESDWARSPSQPTVLCSTIDQIGSRVLFRGYGVSDRMKPVHAGLIGADCLILLDEAHLARPFRQTLAGIRRYQGQDWCDVDRSHPARISVALLSATPEKEEGEPAKKDQRPFSLAEQDFVNEVLQRRLSAPKPARLVVIGRSAKKRDEVAATDVSEDAALVREAVAGTLLGMGELRRSGIDNPALGVVMNRVVRARAVFNSLRQAVALEKADCILMIGPSRPVDRNEIVHLLDPVRSRLINEPRHLARTLVLVATQCIEVGVDIDLDGLITEAAPLSSLRQRFGRLNRMGRDVQPFGLVIAGPHVIRSNYDDPVYGGAIAASWEYLQQVSWKEGSAAEGVIDLGITSLARILKENPPPESTEPKFEDAPILLPAHVDLLSQTSPIPSADPEIAIYLHGAGRASDSVVLLWRADIDPQRQDSDQVRRLLLLMPPTPGETIELPLWSVKRWLVQDPQVDALADIPGQEPDVDSPFASARQVYRWCGDDDRSRWVTSEEIRPGDTIVVPGIHGGIDEFGWNPASASHAARDVAEAAAASFEGSRFTVRVTPELIGETVSAASLAAALSGAASFRWDHLRDAVLTLPVPQSVRSRLEALDRARGKRAVRAYLDLYGTDAEERPQGVVFSAAFGLRDGKIEDRAQFPSTEDDAAGSLAGYSLSLTQHSKDVQVAAREFATRAGLPEDRIEDLSLAGYLHDSGKADPRFQSWLHYGDPFGPDPDDPEQTLAKSRRNLPGVARHGSNLPAAWRHEALSVRLALAAPHLSRARDPELVVWLIGTHHGYGRPFFPHDDPADLESRRLPPVLDLPSELAAGFGPQSLSFEWNGQDWCGLFERLKLRYGVWALAHMEAILRLADHRASAAAENRALAAEAE